MTHTLFLFVKPEQTMMVRDGATVVQEVEKSFSNQKVASSIPCRSVLEQDTEPLLIAPDVQCAISVNVKCVYILEQDTEPLIAPDVQCAISVNVKCVYIV